MARSGADKGREMTGQGNEAWGRVGGCNPRPCRGGAARGSECVGLPKKKTRHLEGCRGGAIEGGESESN